MPLTRLRKLQFIDLEKTQICDMSPLLVLESLELWDFDNTKAPTVGKFHKKVTVCKCG
jgi:hypothetical protein